MSSSAPFSPAPITPCSSHTPPASDLSIPPVKVTRLGCGLPKMLCFDRYSFVVGGLIGEGGFGRVISALLEGTNKWYAIKIICKRRQYGTSGPGRIGIFYERDVMRQADCYNLPFVNRLLASWDDSEHVYLVMPLYQRNLISWIRERELYTIECYDNILQVATVELIQSLEALWSTGYIHRDIKPDNIMQDRNGHLILCDFGLAIPITHPPSPLVGTLCYMAPEIQSSDPVRYTHKSDIWSLGVVLLEMHLRRSMSYFGSCIDCTDNEILQQVQHRTINFNAIHDDLARDLIRSMLQRDPERRCTLNEIKQHPYFEIKCWDSSRRQRMSDEDVSSPMRFPKAVELKPSCPPVYSSLNYESICQGLTEDAENTHMYSHISVRFLDQGVIPRF
ncbi:hypothetical protein QCA50_017374 [Cerrena zonata]|uniref:non-specific serine/threonine protein kinase n=1 Tax=Cerrena zonata TaxID=2478898 RepID=A0AAW0FQW0_9APHY